MSARESTSAPGVSRAALVEWTARLGAVTADALARREQTGLASARSRLVAAARRGDLARSRPLTDWPSVFTVTRAGLRACGCDGPAPVRITAAGAAHAIVCARTAAWLEANYPGHEVVGEPQLRMLERGPGTGAGRTPGCDEALAASLSALPLPHRPDLLLAAPGNPGAAVAFEVELTAKAPRRLQDICRTWARCRSVAGVVYLAPPPVERALRRAVAAVRAERRVFVMRPPEVGEGAFTDPIPGAP